MELIVFIGIPASGKSTFYKQHFFDSHLRLNLDMLKTRTREKILFDACLESKTKIVLDNTNPFKKQRERVILTAKRNNYRVIGYYFCSKVEDAVKRNKVRVKPIPDIAIYAISKKMQLPALGEGFDTLYSVIIEHNSFNIKEWSMC